MFSRKNLSYEALSLGNRSVPSDEDMTAAAAAHLEVMRQRHSIRDFDTKPVPRQIIEDCIQTAGLAPSGANHQPWHFALIGDDQMKAEIRAAAEQEERNFYESDNHDEWIKALEPIGTGPDKPHLVDAPWLIVIFAERYGQFDDGQRYKNYYVPESVGIAAGFLITALHLAGLSCLTHTPNPMQFLTEICNRPKSNKPVMILAVGHRKQTATIPAAATIKKPLDDILSRF